MATPSKNDNGEERPYPLTKLSEAIRTALEPLRAELLSAIKSLTAEIKALNVHLAEQRAPKPVKEKEVDLESSIKAVGMWECGDSHCRQCSVEQNMTCMAEKGVGPKKGV